MKIFDLESKLGEKVYGYLNMFEHPHGTIEKLPIAIIEGKNQGPVFLLTANIHGNELQGLIAIQEIIQELVPDEINGIIIIVPSLNPGGLLTLTRSPFYDNQDPNRLWPNPKPKKEQKFIYSDPYEEVSDPEKNPSVQEQFYTKFASIFDHVDYYIDLHCHATRSLPFSYLDRVYYDEKVEGEQEKAELLFQKTLEFVKSYGFTIVIEGTPRDYFKNNLQRSTTGSFVNKYRKPGFTVELGPSDIVLPEIVKAAKKGIYNTLIWLKMIKKEPQEIIEFPVHLDILWREVVIRTKSSGFYIPKVKPGELVAKEQEIISVHNIFGETIEKIKAPEKGIVLAFFSDTRCYPNRPLAVFLIENKLEYIFPWEYEKKEEKDEEKKED